MNTDLLLFLLIIAAPITAYAIWAFITDHEDY